MLTGLSLFFRHALATQLRLLADGLVPAGPERTVKRIIDLCIPLDAGRILSQGFQSRDSFIPLVT